MKQYHMRNNPILYNLYQVYKYLLFFPLLGIITTVIFITLLPIILFGSDRAIQRVGIIWAKCNSYVTPMFVKVFQAENADPTRSYVIVANHQSQYDIFAVYGWLPLDFRWVMKQELRPVPIIGYFCYRAGHVYIDRSNSKGAIESINNARKRIKGGTSIFFFPEGTRGEGGILLPFKKGAFKFAVDMQLPVLPVSIIGTAEILPSNTISLFPGCARLVIHEPIEITGYTEQNIENLMERARVSIQKGLNDFNPGRK